MCVCVLQRHMEYLQRGQRFGSFTRRSGGGNSYLDKEEKEKINKNLSEAEIKIDQMLSGNDAEIELEETQNCGLLVSATLSPSFTRELWELLLSSLRASLRPALSSSPLDVNTAYLVQTAGGQAAVKRDLLRFVAAALQRKCSIQHKTQFLGDLQFAEDIDAVASRYSPGCPLTLKLQGERKPRVRFKRPYKGLRLRVPRKPYAKGHLFKLTESYLRFKFSSTEKYENPNSSAKDGDALLLQVEDGWFEERDGSIGPRIPPEYICGPTTLDLVEPWIPSELLESVRGISAGEVRTIRVSVPFKTSHLLDINERQQEIEEASCSGGGSLHASESQATAAPAAGMKAGERADEEPAEAGRSLVPMYLKNIANTTKEQLFKSLFGQQKKAAEAEDEEATSAPKTATEESATGAEKSETEENTDTQSNEENAEDEEIHHIDCLLQVKCLEVKRRIWPVVDDAFFKKNCQMTRNELFDAAEEAAEELAKSAASKYALGAAAQALDEITQVEVAESLFEAQAKATWQQQVKAREFQGEKDKRTESKEEFAKWKEENRRGIENILRTAFAIQAVFQQERLQVDEAKLHKDLAKAMLQTTGEAPEMVLKQLYKKAQASVVYDFIVKHANVEYYIDDTPAQVTVQPEGTGIPQQGIRAFPRGVDVKEWHQMRKETIEQRDKLKEQAQRFFVDPKTLKKFNQDDSNKL